ncbi:MAG: Calx-beta domain-containing protein [Kineosporiaceae bacterium]
MRTRVRAWHAAAAVGLAGSLCLAGAQGGMAAPAAAPATPSRAVTSPAAGDAAALASPAGDAAQRLQRRLRSGGAGAARVRVRPGTGAATFVAAEPGRAIRPSAQARSDAQPLARTRGAGVRERDARAFLQDYGQAFGVTDPARDLTQRRTVDGADGGAAVRFQQLREGVPVLGGELVVTVDASGDTTSANGEVATSLQQVPTTPSRTAAQAARRAVRETAGAHGVAASALTAGTPALWIYDPALLGAPGPQAARLVWRVEVTGTDLRRLVLVDARTGTVALAFDQNPHARTRYVCDLGNRRVADETCRSPYSRSEGAAASTIPDVNRAYDYAGATYDYFKGRFGRDSIDGRGMAIKSSVRYCSTDPDDSCPFDNAFWNGSQMVYGAGYASADDVVGHELTHGVTENTAGLFYYGEAGAINESVSDIFGELIDQTDKLGNDATSVRWRLGEDLPDGAVRDMRNPATFGDPDRVGSASWYAGLADSAGVHTNSGVGNKAASLMVDGGTFNGVTVAGIGEIRTALVYYEALTRLMTSATDYRDLFDLLPQACANLVGSNAITTATCQSVRGAVTATEMDDVPAGAVARAPVCPPGQFRADLFADDLESPGAGRWQVSTVGGFGWSYPQDDNPYGYPFSYASSGTTSMWGDDPDAATGGSPSDSRIAMTSDVTIPSDAVPYLRFNHAWSFWSGGGHTDGGQLVYSTDGGSTWTSAAALPAVNGFTSGSVSALGGGPGWTGASRGWAASRFDLSDLAGESVRFGFRVASSADSDGDLGWFVDDVAVYTCTTSLPARPASVSVSDARAREGEASAAFTVTRSSTVGTASVRVRTTPGTATAGDFTAVDTTVTFGAGQSSVTVPVTVLQDPLVEVPETFTVDLSDPVGVVVDDGTGVATINSDDAGGLPTLSISDAWGAEGNSGTKGMAFTITRTGDTSQPAWATVATSAGSASASDFVTLAPQSLTFTPGVTSKTVWVQARGDTLAENNETFTLAITSAANATISDGSGVGTIVDDEGPVANPVRSTFSVSDVVVAEPASGAVAVQFTVSRGGDVSTTGSVVVATADDTARAGADYLARVAGVQTFTPGQRTRVVNVTLNGDNVAERPERFRFVLSSPVNAVLADALAYADVVDTDTGLPSALAVGDAVAVEPATGTAALTFTVTRTGAGSEAATAAWAVWGGAAPSASFPSDYAPASGSVVVPAGQTSATVTVQVKAWSRFEPVENLRLVISAPGNTAIRDAIGMGRIVDND